jgi:outer membrane receptor protein involved in Fe transport
VSALDRVEVLRDGASAIYGTDAIGGVINFITKRSVQGGSVSVERYQPQASGAGAESRINISGGYGDLNRMAGTCSAWRTSTSRPRWTPPTATSPAPACCRTRA